MSEERWRPVVGHEGEYEVSDLGRVRSIARVQTRYRDGEPYAYPIAERILVPTVAARGSALHVALGRGVIRKVHHLVLGAFVGPRPDGMEGLHEDDDTANNELGNLSWGTHLKNMADAAARGRTARGERSPRATFSEEQVLEIDALLPEKTDSQIAPLFGVRRETVKNIRRRERWRHLLGDTAPGQAVA